MNLILDYIFSIYPMVILSLLMFSKFREYHEIVDKPKRKIGYLFTYHVLHVYFNVSFIVKVAITSVYTHKGINYGFVYCLFRYWILFINILLFFLYMLHVKHTLIKKDGIVVDDLTGNYKKTRNTLIKNGILCNILFCIVIYFVLGSIALNKNFMENNTTLNAYYDEKVINLYNETIVPMDDNKIIYLTVYNQHTMQYNTEKNGVRSVKPNTDIHIHFDGSQYKTYFIESLTKIKIVNENGIDFLSNFMYMDKSKKILEMNDESLSNAISLNDKDYTESFPIVVYDCHTVINIPKDSIKWETDNITFYNYRWKDFTGL